jgi:hypothetical protein
MSAQRETPRRFEHPTVGQRLGKCPIVVANDVEIDDQARPVIQSDFAPAAQEVVDKDRKVRVRIAGDHIATVAIKGPRIYIAAVQPDVGESLSDLAEKIPPAAKSIGPVGDGFLAVNPDAFPSDFAADAPEPVARFMAISQVPVSGDALKAKATVAAWKEKLSYAVVATQDRMINPDLERFMTKRAQSQVIELPGSHAIFLSHAPEVAALIEKAAAEAK